MSETMRDRVARAIRERSGLSWSMSRLAADAVLAVMREPTGAMKDAGAESYGVHEPAIGSLPLSVIDGQPSKAWRAMIDAAGRAPAPAKDKTNDL
jgi:hypothetical protein